MAVEKSYARLGLFLVVRRSSSILATALLFIERMRSREVIELVTYTHGERQPVSICPARSATAACRSGACRHCRSTRRGRTIEIDFEVFLDRLTTIGANVDPDPRNWPSRGCSPGCAPRWWAIR